MSFEQIDALIRSAEHDRPLADALRRATDLKALVGIGAARGHVFTENELSSYIERLSEALSEEELASVSGGAGSLAAESTNSELQHKIDRCFIKSWSTSGDA